MKRAADPAVGRWRLVAAATLLGLACAACGDRAEPPAPAAAKGRSGDAREGPATARWDMVEKLRNLRDRPRHPSDGAGRAWLEREGDPAPAVVAAGSHRFTIVFQTGPHGIAAGGLLIFRLPDVGGWSIPQVDRPRARGYTAVEPDADDVELRIGTDPEQKALVARVAGRPLRPGERVRIRYGAGPGHARVDRYAERGARFWIAVDGDGDGAYAYLEDSPGVDVLPGPPAALLLTAPSTARPGESFPVHLTLLDAHRNAGPEVAAELELRSVPPGLALPERVALAAGSGGRAVFPATAERAGVFRVEARSGDTQAASNAIVAGDGGPRILWGDLHGHSSFSDGTGTPEDYFRYARDAAGLDVVALTDHDHLGILRLDAQPERWEEIRRQVARFHEPGRFVTLLGYEWTSWIHGHRHVLYFSGEGEILSSMDPRYESPGKLWRGLAGSDALTFAHHSAGGPIATNWEIPPDPEREPVTEIASIHGHSEAPDAPVPIARSVPGNFVRDALDRGYRLGFVGSGDTHDGHPGVTHIGYRSGGLAAILAEERTRDAVREALAARRVYATSGARIVLRARLDDAPMGAELPVPPDGGATLRVRVVGTGPLERLDVVRSGAVRSVPGLGRRDFSHEARLEGLVTGEYVYVRAVQVDGGTAWSSPFFVGSKQ